MNRILVILALSSGFVAIPLLGGCEHEVRRDSTTVTTPEGGVSQQETKVTERPNGDVVKETHKVNTP